MLWSPDWVRHILSRRLQTEPGEHFAYSSAGSHLLSAIVADLSGQSPLAFVRAKLFDPLGIRTDDAFEPALRDLLDPAVLKVYRGPASPGQWIPRATTSAAASCGCPHETSRNSATCTSTAADGTGNVPADFVAAATSPRGSTPNLTKGYGWHWWVATEGDHRTFRAQGYGGQYIYVVPDLDLVAVITSDPDTTGLDPKILITRTIVPAVGP